MCLLFQTFLIIFSNTPPHQLGDHVNVKRPFRANSTSANSNSRDNSLNRSYSQDAATAMHRSYTQDSTANHKAMNRSYIQDSTTAGNSVMNRSYIQDSTTAAGNNLMNRSFSQDSATANAKQRQETAAVNGAASGGRSKKLAIGGGSMSRSLVQESSTSADRRSIDESLALIQHHVQVGSFSVTLWMLVHSIYLTFISKSVFLLCVCASFMFMVGMYYGIA
jgi:hypothetical protein